MANKNRPRHLAGKTKRVNRENETSKAPIASSNTDVASAAPSDAALNRPLMPVTSVAQPKPTKGSQPSRTVRPTRAAINTINTNYDYVTSDLKRIGILSVAMFAVMGILTVVLH